MKPCPICSRNISANKELCLECKNAHGSLAEFTLKQTAAAEAMPATKKARKPRAKKAIPVAA